MLLVDNKFEINQTVYLITDIEQKPRLVIGFYIDISQLSYKLVSGNTISYHADIEITSEKQTF